MEILVDHPRVKVSVSNADGLCVCTRCKGGKTETQLVSFRRAENFSFLSASWRTGPCRACGGRGFWRGEA